MSDYEKVKRLASSILALRETYDHHGPRVARLAVTLAAASGLAPAQIELIEVGGYLHDIGKVLIRKDLLNMPRRLSPEEISEMRLHAMYGWTIVEQSGFDQDICNIVRHHHERYDGNGYPDRLRGEDIPIEARTVAICDAYEALIEKRSYREAYSPEDAATLMQAERGRAFDPQLLDLFFTKVLQS